MIPEGESDGRFENDPVDIRWRLEAPEPPSVGVLQAEDELAGFFEQSLDLLCIAGLDGYFKHLNPAWTAALGWTLEELEAKPFLEFVHCDDREATQAEVASLAEGTDTICFENRYRHRDGSYRWLRWNARRVVGQRIYASAREVTRQKQLERKILQIVDHEKERLGREIHDGLCQTLAGIAALSSTLTRRLAAESAAASMAAEIAGLLNDAIAEARRLAHGLDPVGLEEEGIDRALESLAQNVRHLFHVDCTFAGNRSPPGLHREAAVHLFRIAQEAVHNAVTHGRAERIEIRLRLDREQGLLSVRDDGIGLPEGAFDSGGIGLHTMFHRSRLIGASLEVRRRAGRGTAVICILPLTSLAVSRDHASESI